MARALNRAATLTLAICAGALLSLPAVAPARGGPYDMGDAPDGARAGYAKPRAGVVGTFPSRLLSGGPRHAGWRALRIGLRADGERDSHQVDRDRYDDGAEATLRRCKGSSRLEVALNGTRLKGPQRAKGSLIYVNAWFDWNRDGDWEDAHDGCAHEWAIRNLAVPAASLGRDGLRLLPIAFKAGKQVRELWWRVTVTLNQPLSEPGGRGAPVPHAFGETEDYLQRRGGGKPIFEEEEPKEKEKPKLGAGCNPFVAVIPHGGTARIGFNIVAPGKGGPVYGAWASPRKGKGWGAKLIPNKNQRGIPAGKVLAVGFAVKSSDVDPPVRFQLLTFKFVFWRGETVRKFECLVLIVHEGKGKGKKHGKHQHPPKIRPVKCKGPCAEGPPPPFPNPPITPLPPDTLPESSDDDDEPPPVEGRGKITNIFEQQIQFEAEFNRSLERFLFFFEGFEVIEGGAVSDGEGFTCEPVGFGGEAFSALSCKGPIKPDVQIQGGAKLNPAPPSFPAPDLYGYEGAQEYGPFPVDPPGP